MPAGVNFCNIYKLSNGVWGYIGQAGVSGGAFTFKDQNITPNIGQQPPTIDTVQQGAAAVGYFEQRRFFGGFIGYPQNILATRSGTESSFGYHIPSFADDRLSFKIAAREASAIQHLVPTKVVLILTPTTEFVLQSSDGNAMTSANLQVRPQSYVGSNNVQPVVVGNAVLFAQSRSARIREMAYVWQTQSYQANDLSVMAAHLFDYHNTIDMCFQRGPAQILWTINEAGTLTGMTYLPEQQIMAWHHHTTSSGYFVACCVIPEANPAGIIEDYLYVITNRTIHGVNSMFVERKRSRYVSAYANNFFVDCGATYSGAPTTTISGLTWLANASVQVLADGVVVGPLTVSAGGVLTLSVAASTVNVGLAITQQLQTLPVATQTPDASRGRNKNVNRVWVRYVNSAYFSVGPSSSNVAAQDVSQIFNGESEVLLPATWGPDGTVWITNSLPTPLEISSMTLEASMGG